MWCHVIEGSRGERVLAYFGTRLVVVDSLGESKVEQIPLYLYIPSSKYLTRYVS